MFESKIRRIGTLFSQYDSNVQSWPLHLESTVSDFRRVPALDGLRAVSIIAVLATHFFLPFGPGGYGVFIFFIISGFLIARLLFAEDRVGKVDVTAFFIRRIFRLYPVLLLCVLMAGGAHFVETSTIAVDEVAAATFYFTNYLLVHKEISGEIWQIEAFRPLWSLAVEEHFYLVFPFLFVLLRTPQRILTLAIMVIVFCAIARYTVAYHYPEIVRTHYLGMLTQFRIDAIAFGVGFAAFCELPGARTIVSNAARLLPMLLAAFILVLGFVIPFDSATKAALRWPLMGFPIVLFIAVIIFSNRYEFAKYILNSKYLVWVGKLSYSLYIWHILVAQFTTIWLDGVPGMILATVLSFFVASLSYRFVETPMIGVGKMLVARRRKAEVSRVHQ